MNLEPRPHTAKVPDPRRHTRAAEQRMERAQALIRDWERWDARPAVRWHPRLAIVDAAWRPEHGGDDALEYPGGILPELLWLLRDRQPARPGPGMTPPDPRDGSRVAA